MDTPIGADQGRPSIDVVIVHPLETVSAALGLLVAGASDLRFVGRAADADAALTIMRTERSSPRCVVLVDQSFRDAHEASSLIRAIVGEFQGATVIAVGMDAGEIAVSRALASAASGFVHLGIPPDRFLDTIRRAASGEEVLEGVPLEAVARIVGRLDRRVAIDGFLTAREREVLAVASEGLTAREIALRLGVRERTVTTHLGHIYRKLGTRGRLAAIAAVNGGGLLDGTIPARVLPVGSVP